MLSDGELLRRYVEEGSEEAFAELVRRHLNMVYFAALRRVGRNAHSADDVTQRVFTDLARKARILLGRPSLAGWLHTGTRFAAAEVVRGERRRRAREEAAEAVREIEGGASSPAVEAALDGALDLLNERQREAVVLHFIEGRTFPEIGAALSLSADAARMRVNRALERLRSGLGRRGIASSAAALAAVLSDSASAASAPSAATIAGRAVRQAGHAAAAPQDLLQRIVSSRFTPWIGGAVAAGGLALCALRLAPAPAVAVPAPGAAPFPVEAAVPPAPSSEAAAAAVPSSSAAADSFADLSEPEKKILKTLWEHRREYGPTPLGTRWAFSVRPSAPAYEAFGQGRELLAARSLVAVNRTQGGVFLTNAGLAFCRANGEQLDAYSRMYSVPSLAARQAGVAGPERVASSP